MARQLDSSVGNERVLLIDASPYIFRSFFALPSSMTSPAGTPINAAHGFTSFLVKILGEERPSHVGVAFDGSLTTSFRNEIYPDYKANREAPPSELVAQVQHCQQAASALGLATEISPTFEADDIIASWLHQTSGFLETASVSVVTSDKDLGQLVTSNVELYDFAKGQRWTAATVREKFGVAPAQLVDFLALAGDSVDNIPGVRGIGPKTASQLLQLFGNLESLLAKVDEIPQSGLRGAAGIARKLLEHNDVALLSKELAILSTEAVSPRESSDALEALVWHGPTTEWPSLCEELGFTSLLERGNALS